MNKLISRYEAVNFVSWNKVIQILVKGTAPNRDLSSNYINSMKRFCLFLLLFCISTIVSAQTDLVVTKRPNEQYEFIGKYSDRGWALVRLRGKYGFIDKKGNEVIPLRFDNIGCGGSQSDVLWHKYTPYISVCNNKKWGYIDSLGSVVVTLSYDKVKNYAYADEPIWVVKNGKYGCVDINGNLIIPIEYEDMESGFYDHRPTFVKKNGKYGFIDEHNNVLIPFKYSTTRGFSIDTNLAPVSINGKYGYINKEGREIIPLEYDFADDFKRGLAAVVRNNQVGFVNELGEVVIPFQYDVEWSSDGNGKTLSNSSFFSGVAPVKKGKWGVIDRKGEIIVSFAYDGVGYTATNGYIDLIKDNKTHYFDKGGNEYVSESERKEHSDLKLANQGFPHSQFHLGRNYYYGWNGYPKDYSKALEWLSKGALGGDEEAQCYMGHLYYYGYGVGKSYKTAYDWYLKASNNNDRDAQYYLGWLYEHAQGVPKDIEEAKRWYSRSAYLGDDRAKERLAKLGSNVIQNPLSLKDLVSMTWLVYEPTTIQKEYSFRIGIKSDSKIEDISVYVNGVLSRGIIPDHEDGYNMTIKKMVPLNDGQNTIKVKVKNAAGTTTTERNVTYTPSKMKIINADGTTTTERTVTYTPSIIMPIKHQKRIALVIGNANYASTRLDSLHSPLKDARDVREKLEKLGFKVRPVIENGSKKTMRKAIMDFIKEAKNYDVALFYYSGHGIQSKPGINATNFLIPSDAKLQFSESLSGECIDLNEMVINNLSKEREGKASLVFIDACRTVLNLPSESDFGETKGFDKELRGLNEQASPEGVCVVYATRAGSVSYDMRQITEKMGQNSLNSYFTQGLLECLDEYKDKNLPMFIQYLKDKVRAKTNGRQVPSPYNELYGDFYFDPDK